MNAFSRIKGLLQIQAALGRFQNQVKGQDAMSLLKNWKTTLAGLISLVSIAGTSLGFLTHEQAAAIAGIAMSFGLISAKDGNVTGGTKPQ